MKVSIPHSYSQNDAVIRVKKLLEEARAKMAEQVSNIEEKWQDNTLHFAFDAQGQHISGTLEVKDKVFELYAKLPLALRLFEGRIQKMIEEQSRQILK
jgi:hypothetical protein